MRHLADACALIEFSSGSEPERTMAEGMPIMRELEVGVLAITVWEIARKITAGKLPPLSTQSVTDSLRDKEFHLLPMTWEDAERAATLPDPHRDPMDRMLIATALRTGMTVITSDRIFQSYGVQTVW